MLLTIIYIIAITAEAMTGALSAGRRSMDWFGVVIVPVSGTGRRFCPRCVVGTLSMTWVKHPEYLMLTCLLLYDDFDCQVDAPFT